MANVVSLKFNLNKSLIKHKASKLTLYAFLATTAFAEDYICTPAVSIGQGSVHISVGTPGAKFICSAEIVSLTDDPPTTLGALDVWPAN
jgi:hypothetical protein